MPGQSAARQWPEASLQTIKRNPAGISQDCPPIGIRRGLPQTSRWDREEFAQQKLKDTKSTGLEAEGCQVTREKQGREGGALESVEVAGLLIGRVTREGSFLKRRFAVADSAGGNRGCGTFCEKGCLWKKAHG